MSRGSIRVIQRRTLAVVGTAASAILLGLLLPGPTTAVPLVAAVVAFPIALALLGSPWLADPRHRRVLPLVWALPLGSFTATLIVHLSGHPGPAWLEAALLLGGIWLAPLLPIGLLFARTWPDREPPRQSEPP